MHRRHLALFGTLVVALAVACRGERATAPSAGTARSPVPAAISGPATACPDPCVLWASAVPLRVAAAPPDSAGSRFPVARVRVGAGGAGNMRLTLTLPASSTEWPIQPESLEVRGPTGAVTVALRAVAAGAVIPIPADTAAGEYVMSLTRRLGSPVKAMTQLIAERPGDRALDALWRPFAPEAAAGALRFAPPAVTSALVDPVTCVVDGPSPPPCGDVVITLSPNFGDGPFGGFQSASGTGIMTPVTVTFSQPVALVRVTALDPTWEGNTATAFGPAGETLSTLAFPYSGVPGSFSAPTVSFTGAISRLLLTPAPLEYIAYRLEVTPSGAAELVLTCPSTAIRGTRVECIVRSSENGSFRIDSAVAFPTGGPPIRLRDTPTTFLPGAADTVRGDLIVTTVLKVWGEAMGSSLLRAPGPGGVSSQMRVWQRSSGSRQ